MDEWMDGRTDGRTDGWMDGWMDGWIDITKLNATRRTGFGKLHKSLQSGKLSART